MRWTKWRSLEHEDDLEALREDIHKAQQAGNTRRAARLYTAELALIAKREGSEPIVGSQGRTA